MDIIKVGERIRQLRLAHNNMSREKLAELADISVSFLYEIETARKSFSADVLERLAQALGVNEDYILHGMAREEGKMDLSMNSLV